MGRMPMMPRFRLPVSQEYAESCLAMAVAAEVESRGHSISPDGDFEQCVRQTAAWTVNASPRHSLLLAGRYGNGKTTFLRALQSLVNALRPQRPNDGKAHEDAALQRCGTHQDAPHVGRRMAQRGARTAARHRRPGHGAARGDGGGEVPQRLLPPIAPSPRAAAPVKIAVSK